MRVMKTLKVSDHSHAKLTSTLGQLMAESGKSKTYSDAMDALVDKSVIFPPEYLREGEEFIAENKDFGYTTIEEFLKDAGRGRMEQLRKSKNVKIHE
jgi:hypothetical protein